MNKLILSMAVMLCGLTLFGCGTISGIGKDIKSVGGVISSGSDHIKESVKNNPPGSKMGTSSESE